MGINYMFLHVNVYIIQCINCKLHLPGRQMARCASVPCVITLLKDVTRQSKKTLVLLQLSTEPGGESLTLTNLYTHIFINTLYGAVMFVMGLCILSVNPGVSECIRV